MSNDIAENERLVNRGFRREVFDKSGTGEHRVTPDAVFGL